MVNHKSNKLPFWVKLIYGSGDFGPASIAMMRSLFFVIYLTDTVGLNPQLASIGAMVGLIWDAINDPIVGTISDRARSRWGRRRPFLLIFSIPFGFASILLWAAPSWESQIALIVYVTIAFMIVDTLGTLLAIPYLSLMPEITKDYDERTSLAGFRTAFQLLGSLSVVVIAPILIDSALESGLTQKNGYVNAATIFGAIAAFLFLLLFLVIRENPSQQQTVSIPFLKTLKLAWSNIPFRFVAIIFLLNWTMLDMVAVVFPFFLLYWIADGNLLTKVNLFGMQIALESSFFGILMLVCILSVPFWLWFSKRRNKRDAYVTGMIFLSMVLGLIFFVQPGQINVLLILGALAGIGVGSAYVFPDAMFPDIIEWDELRARKRQEGIYYGARAFIRKLATALVIFIVLQLLGLSGYQTPPIGVDQFNQPESAILLIRILISIISGIMLLTAALLAWFNPLTREKNARIQKLLDQRKTRAPIQD